MKDSSQEFGNPAEALEGMALENGWRVIRILRRKPDDTGGNFSVGYLVEKDGEKGFLKALDLTFAFRSEDIPRTLQLLTSSFVFERDLLYKCKGSRLSRIVTPIDHGQVNVPGYPPYMAVSFIIFDLAKCDIRTHIEQQKKFDLAWILRCLHDASAALEQLHRIGIAHQDVKPSNVLIYTERLAKLADLGTASDRGQRSENDRHLIPGDRTYAPLERFYSPMPMQEFDERVSTDLFLLGSLVYFFFLKVSAQQVIWTILNHKGLVSHLTQTSFLADLPYIQDAYGESLGLLSSEIAKYSDKLAPDLMPLVRMLCDPDPSRRGHRVNVETGVNRYSLERFISGFDVLAKKAEYGVL